MTVDATTLSQAYPLPSRPRPIVIIGAGSIVADAHLPAYRKAGFSVAGLYDRDGGKARALAATWNVRKVFGTLEEAAVQQDVVFDVAVPPVAQLDVLGALREGAVVLVRNRSGSTSRRRPASATSAAHAGSMRRSTSSSASRP